MLMTLLNPPQMVMIRKLEISELPSMCQYLCQLSVPCSTMFVHRGAQMSGGQKQRIAIGKFCVHQPPYAIGAV